MVAPGALDKERRFIRRTAGRLGLDFFVAGLKYLNRQVGEYLCSTHSLMVSATILIVTCPVFVDVVKESVSASTMSPTGFVTFLDLASVTCAACTPLTNKPNVLLVSVAPEPRYVHLHV